MEINQRWKNSVSEKSLAPSEEKEDDANTAKSAGNFRYIFAAMGFWGFVCMYTMRVNVSVAIVAMVSTGTDDQPADFVAGDTCPAISNTNSTAMKVGEFDWDEETQGIILSSYFYGYIIMMVPAGILAGKYGGKKTFLIGLSMMTVMTLLCPMAARTNVVLLILCRAFMGFFGGFMLPSMHAMLGHWVPPMERSRLTSIVYSGMNLGTVIGIPLAGILSNSDFMGGWPSAFYVFGIFSAICCVCIFFLVYESPATHPMISDEERKYITQSLGDTVEKIMPPVPWKAILMSPPVWAITIIHFGESWTFYTLMTELPTYMSNILHFDMTSNSILSAMPYMAMWICTYLFSMLADYLRSRKIISTLAARKLFQAISDWGIMVPLLCMAYDSCNLMLTIVVLNIGFGINSAFYSGYFSNHIDLSPNFAGPLVGISSTIANSAGILAPFVVGALTNRQQTIHQWRIVYLIAAGVTVVSDVVYLIFAQAEEQSWNKQTEETNPQAVTDLENDQA